MNLDLLKTYKNKKKHENFNKKKGWLGKRDPKKVCETKMHIIPQVASDDYMLKTKTA